MHVSGKVSLEDDFVDIKCYFIEFCFKEIILQNLFYVPFIKMNLLVFFIFRNMADC
jgi:hypothetical protein